MPSNIPISRTPAIRYIAFFSDRLSSLQIVRQILKMLKQWMIIFYPRKKLLHLCGQDGNKAKNNLLHLRMELFYLE